jgi:thiol-disulfide isomerase/thioredoxin
LCTTSFLQMAPPRWAQNLDLFRTVPKDLAESSPSGALMTLIAVITCAVLFICETSAFLTSKTRTDVLLDTNQDSQLQINFDVTMHDMACDHVTVGVWDAFGTERMNITKNILKQRLDHKGENKGHFYTDEELTELEFADLKLSEEQKQELDADWSSSSDQFKHDDFQSVIDAHDFTFVNFYAEWCPHCRMFAPTWDEFERSLNAENDPIVDADGVKANVRALKINCVDFEEACQQQKIMSFPTIRLYRRGTKNQWSDFHGPREIEPLKSFARDEVKQRHIHTGATFHQIFTESCRIKGTVEVARVPGTVHFQAMHTKDRSLNLAFTNVSHTVHSFTFGQHNSRMTNLYLLPSEYQKHADPLAERTFAVERFHQAPHHYIKAVHTRFSSFNNLRSYQQTHQWSIRNIQRNSIPQAKFSYDLAPVEVVVSKSERRWYDYITNIFAIIGGAFTFMSMTSGFLNFASAKFKSSINKLG